MSKYISARELADILGLEVVGKLKRLPNAKFGFDGSYPVYVDEAGNRYHLGLVGDVCPGVIVDTHGKIH